MEPAFRCLLSCWLVIFLFAQVEVHGAPKKKQEKVGNAKPEEPPRERYWTFVSRQSKEAPETLKGIDRHFHLDYALPLSASREAVFFTSRIDHRLGCLDANTGELRWSFTAGAGFHFAPTYAKGKVYAGCDDGHVYCLDAKGGKLLWKAGPPADRTMIAYGRIISAWPVRTNVLVEEGVAYFGRGVFPHDGTFVEALDAETGERKWRNAAAGENPLEWSALSPCGYLKLEEDQLLVPNDQMGVRPIYKADGRTAKIRKKLKRWPNFLPVPVAADGRRFVSTHNGEIYCEGPPRGQPEKKIEEPIGANPIADLKAAEAAATAITKHSGVKEGYALLLDCDKGSLALALAQQTKLTVYAIFLDQTEADAARAELQKTGLYGSRIIVRQVAPDEQIPYPEKFADLVVSEAAALGKRLPQDFSTANRFVKPIWGVALIGGQQTAPTVRDWSQKQGDDWEIIEADGVWAKYIRQREQDAGGWTHQYADAGNSGCSHDAILKPPLGVVWFGEPLSSGMVNRTGIPPLLIDGVLVSPGAHSISAHDAYTGRQLWRREMKYASRKNPFGGTTNVIANRDSVFMIYGHQCLRLDLLTGEQKAAYTVPGGGPWGWLACDEQRLYGSKGNEAVSSNLFAIDLKTGEAPWFYGNNPEGEPAFKFLNNAIAVGEGQVFLVANAYNPEARKQAIDETLANLKNLPQEEQERIKGELDKRDVRFLIAVDGATGKEVWWRGIDVTDAGGAADNIESIQTKKTKYPIGLAYRDGVLIHFSISAGGKYWGNWVNDRWAWRAIGARSAEDGSLLWFKPVNYKSRPVIIDDTIHAEPWALDLRTGEFKTREHPITGEQSKWTWCRNGKHCGIFSASKHFLFGRSAGLGYHDLLNDRGLYTFFHSRPSCWLDVVSGSGLMVKPPQSFGCSCSVSATFTIAMGQVSRPPATAEFAPGWGEKLPVKQLRLNLGAEGDRHDEQGRLWLATHLPRQPKLPLLQFQAHFEGYEGAERLSPTSLFTEIEGADIPFVFASGHLGLRKVAVTVAEPDSKVAKYTVRLGFAAPPGDQAGQRVFDVKLQDKLVLDDFDIVKAAGAADRAVWKEFQDIDAATELALELVAPTDAPTPQQMPILSGLEILRTND